MKKPTGKMQNLNPEMKAILNDIVRNPKYRKTLMEHGPSAAMFALGLAKRSPKLFFRGFGVTSLAISLFLYRKELLQLAQHTGSKAEDVFCSSGLCCKLNMCEYCDNCPDGTKKTKTK
jgi:hypothetical protein